MELGVASIDSETRVELDDTKSFEFVRENCFFYRRKRSSSSVSTEKISILVALISKWRGRRF